MKRPKKIKPEVANVRNAAAFCCCCIFVIIAIILLVWLVVAMTEDDEPGTSESTKLISTKITNTMNSGDMSIRATKYDNFIFLSFSRWEGMVVGNSYTPIIATATLIPKTYRAHNLTNNAIVDSPQTLFQCSSNGMVPDYCTVILKSDGSLYFYYKFDDVSKWWNSTSVIYPFTMVFERNGISS